MIEITIRTHLVSALDVPVFLEQPENAPKSFVLFEKTGSAKSDKLPSSTFAFQSYAESLQKTAQLNNQVKEAVESLIQLDEIASVRLNSDYNFTDTATKRYRYQAVFDIYHY